MTAFVAAFQSIGYELCDEVENEEGFEKVAIYSIDGRPTHAARQLAGGRWSSKLGVQEDIEHVLDALNGPVYGQVAAVLRRPRPGDSSSV